MIKYKVKKKTDENDKGVFCYVNEVTFESPWVT